MTREIKFRVWDKSRRCMLSGFDCCGYEETCLMDLIGDTRYQPLQFTGLKDKDGNEIYEGDILRWHHGASPGDHGVDQVLYTSGQFHLEKGYGLEVFCSPWSDTVQKPLEVIGNIYENPELLT